MPDMAIDQNSEWAAIAPLIQAKQREMAERLQLEQAQPRSDVPPSQQIRPSTETTGVRLDGRRLSEAAEDARASDPKSSAQLGIRAHIAFKAQDGAPKSGVGIGAEAEATDETGPSDAAQKRGSGPNDLTEDEQRVVKELQARDAEVRRHEQAHAAVGGSYASAPTYVYQQGPDGRRYAIGGSVRIDMSPVPNDPEATLAKMAVVRRAAMAPAEPSSADRAVAAAAQAAQAQALADLNAQRAEERSGALDKRS